MRAINCSLANDLYKSLRKRIEERRTVYSALLNFLRNPNKESDFDNDLDKTIIKSRSKSLILRFAKGSEKKFLYHSISLIASQMRRTILPLLKCYLMPSISAKAL